MLTLQRIYYNAADEVIRIDTIMMVQKYNVLVTPLDELTWERHLTKQLTVGSGSRTVSYIELTGTFDSFESSSGNFLSASWTTPAVTANMSSLPQVGGTV